MAQSLHGSRPEMIAFYSEDLKKMDLTQDSAGSHLVIEGFGAGTVSVGGVSFQDSFVVLPNRRVDAWPVRDFDELSEEALAGLLRLDWDILLLGTGSDQRFPDLEIQRTIAEHGRSVDFMSSRSACSTYNLLALDSRAVAAAIILPFD